MARPLRIEFAGASYHVMSRGNARQAIFQDDGDRQRLCSRLEASVQRFGWRLMTFVFMPNHLHLLLRTPEPNLARGMQFVLSGYANWYAKRHQRPGHLFQGRYKGELIEDDSYFWTASRYIHLNPVRGRRPLAAHPRDWPWSSYAGYADKRRRLDWVSYDLLLGAWRGEMGGKDPVASYRRFVEAAMADPPPNPFASAVNGWLLGSKEFVHQVRAMANVPDHFPKHIDEVPAARRLQALAIDELLEVVARHYGLTVAELAVRRRADLRYVVAAGVARRYTSATRRELAQRLGLGHPDSVGNLLRRFNSLLRTNASLQEDVRNIELRLRKTENRV